ncbi:MAG: hypothetical protein ACO35G_09930 [Vulcanococcus sp.]|jgi:hypothetical protein
MVEAVRTGDVTLRLVDQLNALSLITESLAFRLVELDERLATVEGQLKSLLSEAHHPGSPEIAALRLEDTEVRIARLEALIKGAGPGTAAKAEAQLALLNQDPFIEEGEQSFMDEMVA